MLKILCDSTCDLHGELLERYNIGIVPLYVRLGEEEYKDGELSQEQLFAWSDKNGKIPKTAAPPPADFQELIGKAFDEGADEVMVFTISSDISASYSNAVLAKEEMGELGEKVYVVDSRNLSNGIAHLAFRASELSEQGMDGAQIMKEMEKLIPLLRTTFTVDTLVYLHRGGRCSGLAAMAGSVLRIHPRINVTDGKMGPGKKYRGNSPKYILDYVHDLEKDLLSASPDRIFITHSILPGDTYKMVEDYLKSLNRFKEILDCPTGTVVSSHCGPGTLGILFMDDEKKE